MRSLFAIMLIGAMLIGTSYWYTATAHVCPVPITYRVGEVDERFAVSPEVVRAAAARAEVAWEEATMRDLFMYDESSTFTIDLVYDERQKLSNTEEEWRIALDQQLARYESLVAELKSLGARYQTAEASYLKERAAYEASLASYNTEVEAYNQSGGAPSYEYDRLQEEASALSDQLDALLETEAALAEIADTVNELGEQGNALIAAYNSEVEEYNAVFGQLTTFTQGEYGRDRITIYKFTDEEELTRVLVHEFGHALGLGHVEGEESAMYYLMTERGPTNLSAADIAAFRSVCGEQPRFLDHVRRSIRLIVTALS